MTGRSLLGIGVILPGLVMSFWAAWSMYRGSLAGGWPTEKGEIISSSADQTGETHKYRFNVAYEYEVDGKIYTSSRYTTADKLLPREEAERLASRNRPGKPVVVHYDPRNPSNAVLEQSFPTWTVPLLVVGIILLVNGLMLLTGSGWFAGPKG